MNALQLSTTQVLRQSSAVEPIRFYSLPRCSGNHRWRRHQAVIALGRKPIIQSVAARSSLIHKRNLLLSKMLANVLHQVLHAVRHVQRADESLLMVHKGRRNALFVYFQSGKHIILLWYKCLLSHAEWPPCSMPLGSGIVAEHSRLGVDIHHTGLRKGCTSRFCQSQLRNPISMGMRPKQDQPTRQLLTHKQGKFCAVEIS